MDDLDDFDIGTPSAVPKKSNVTIIVKYLFLFLGIIINASIIYLLITINLYLAIVVLASYRALILPNLQLLLNKLLKKIKK